MATNDQLGEMAGTLAERPPAAAQRAGTLWTAPDGTVYQVQRNPVTGAQTWLAVAGPGAAGAAGWSKYVVAPAAGPPAPFQSIQAAVAAAVADGHSELNPTTVVIFPGAYAGNVTLAPGVNLLGLGGRDAEAVTIQGNLVAALASAGGANVENLAVNGHVAFGGTQTQNLRMFRCQVAGTDGPGILINAGALGGLTLDACIVRSSAPLTDPALSVQGSVNVVALESQLGASDAGIAVLLAAAVSLFLRGCLVNGATRCTDAAVVRAFQTTFQNADNSLFDLGAAGANVNLAAGCFVQADTEPVVAGAAGDFVCGDLLVGRVLSVAPGVTSTSAVVAQAHLTVEASTSLVAGNDEADTYGFSGLAGPATFTLPPSQGAAATARDGREIAVAKDASAFTVTVAPAAGDTINAGAVVLAAGAPHGAILRLNRAANRWNVISLF